MGKLAIAKSILAAERASKLFISRQSGRRIQFSDVSGTWLIPFFQIISEGVAKVDLELLFKNITIINFNYDRCIEYFLPLAIQLYYGVSAQEAQSAVESLSLVHPYGSVGSLHPSTHGHHVEFGSEDYSLKDVAGQIKTFSEGLHLPTHQLKITDSINAADQIVFLGFAYHPLNMRILESRERTRVSKVFGTTIGLSKPAIGSVTNAIFHALQKKSVRQGEPAHSSYVSEMNLESEPASVFLREQFRGIAD